MNELDFIDYAVETVGIMVELQCLRKRLTVALRTDSEECGNCEHWMKSNVCPREVNVKGMNEGPHMYSVACKEFQCKQWVKALKRKRFIEIRESEYYPYLREREKELVREGIANE